MRFLSNTRLFARLACLLASSASLLAQTPTSTPSSSQPASAPAASQPAVPASEQAKRAREWIGRPARDEPVDRFSTAAEVRYREYKQPKPLRVWIAKVDLTAPGVRFAVTEPLPQTGEDGKKYETLCQNTLEFAQARGVQLAINTSAFSPFRAKAGMPMDLTGLAATEGTVFSQADRSNGAIYIGKDNRVRLKGPALKADDALHVVPGFRLLLDDEKIVISDKEANTSFGGVNPRTAVGVGREGKTLWIVVVDGRQPGISAGITLVELATLFESLGAWDALNLDGGGSSTFVLQDKDGVPRVINTPVGQKLPGSLRQVGHNLGLHLPAKAEHETDRKP